MIIDSNSSSNNNDNNVLIKAINALRPQQPLIERINTKPIALLERENIDLYLQACAKLGVQKADLFRINDLYEKQYAFDA